MVRDFGDLFFTREPPGHTVSMHFSKWGSIEVRIDGGLVIDDSVACWMRLKKRYDVDFGEGHLYSLVLKRPIIKTHFYQFISYLDGKKVRARSHSFFLQRFRESPTPVNFIVDVLDYNLWPFFTFDYRVRR